MGATGPIEKSRDFEPWSEHPGLARWPQARPSPRPSLVPPVQNSHPTPSGGTCFPPDPCPLPPSSLLLMDLALRLSRAASLCSRWLLAASFPTSLCAQVAEWPALRGTQIRRLQTLSVPSHHHHPSPMPPSSGKGLLGKPQLKQEETILSAAIHPTLLALSPRTFSSPAPDTLARTGRGPSQGQGDP